MSIAWLDGKFHLSTAMSKAINPENFNEELGVKYATKDALDMAQQTLGTRRLPFIFN